MSGDTSAYRKAEDLRAVNQQLDSQLLTLVRSVQPQEVARGPGNAEWNVAENLAHLAEFPSYFARQLGGWLDRRVVVVGRVAEYSAERNDAIVQAERHPLDAVVAATEQGLRDLAAVLGRLADDDLDVITHNVKYGPEPLRAYLDRYLIGHKAAHLSQLRTALDWARNR